MLQTTASEFAKQLKVNTFKASKGWPQSLTPETVNHLVQ
jgi:hypothetical protein